MSLAVNRIAFAGAWIRRHLRPSPGILAGLLAVYGLGGIMLGLLVWGSRGFAPLPMSFASGLLSMGGGTIAASINIIVGWRLITRLPSNPIGWLILVSGLTFAMVIPISLLVDQAHETFRPAPASTLTLAWLQASFGIPILVGANLLAGMLYPDGRLVGPRWWPAPVIAVSAVALIALSAAIAPSGLVWYTTLPNPMAAPAGAAGLVAFMRSLGVILALVAAGLMVASVVRRYRIGDAIVRAQLRWILFAVAIELVLWSAFVIVLYAARVPDDVGEMFVALGEVASTALPIAAAFAITRHHLFGIDVLISRTVLYALIMAVLGGLSTGIAALTQRLFVALTGAPSDASLVVAVFLAAAAYTPVRRRLEGTVDRWTKGATGGRVPDPVSEEAVPAGVERIGAAGEPGEPRDRQLWETAAALLALQRFEARFMTSSDPSGSLAEESVAPDRSRPARRPIDATGRVACPRGSDVPVTDCLGCSGLSAILTSAKSVLCALAPDEPDRARARPGEPF